MLAVAGGKGGTGKTTTALGLGSALAGGRRRPVVVDADVDMPDLAVVAGVPLSPGLDALAAGAAVERAVHDSPRIPGVGIAPATPGATVTAALPALADVAPVLLDCPAGAAADAAAPLRAADRALVVTTPRRPAVADALKTAAAARSLGTPVAAVAVTRAERVPAGLPERFDAPGVAVPPATGPPLDDDGVLAAYGRLAAEITV